MPYASDRTVEREAWFYRLGFIAFATVAILGAAGVLGDRASIVFRAAAIYLFLLVVFRIAGRRTLAQSTTFDLVLILIIGDSTQQALLGEDHRLGSGALAIVSLVALDIAFSHLKRMFPALDKVVEGSPILLKTEATFKHRAMSSNSVDDDDLLAAAREQGLTDLDEIRQATLEKDGQISIVPGKRQAR